jgi:hypothetical protein
VRDCQPAGAGCSVELCPNSRLIDGPTRDQSIRPAGLVQKKAWLFITERLTITKGGGIIRVLRMWKGVTL